MFERMIHKDFAPTIKEIHSHMGEDMTEIFKNFDNYLKCHYEIIRELKFPFGNDYGWGYKYSSKKDLLCYVFFEKNAFTVTITIGKSELPKLIKIYNSFLPKTKELWDNRYPCGDGGWIHYRVFNDNELSDIQSIISVKKKPNLKIK
jgi:hypothetical protein